MGKVNPATQAQAEKEEQARTRSLTVQSSAILRQYGTPEELAEMIRRYKMLVPGGKGLADEGVMALAQFGILTGLSPFNSECGYFNDAPHALIRGFRKKGREFLAERGSHEELRYVVMVDAIERRDLGIPDGALAVKCIGAVTHKLRAWNEAALQLREIIGKDAPWDQLANVLGPRPETTGYGVVHRIEMERAENPSWVHKCAIAERNTITIEKTGKDGRPYTLKLCKLWGFAACPDCNEESRAQPCMFPHVQRAEKRAEAHWWKKETDLQFDLAPGVEDGGEIIDGVALDLPEEPLTGVELETAVGLAAEQAVTDAELDAASPEELQVRAQEAKDTLYAEPDEKKRTDGDRRRQVSFWKPAVLEAIVEKHYAANGFEAAGMLAHSDFPQSVDVEPALIYARAYRASRDEGKTPTEAGAIGANMWTKAWVKRGKSGGQGGEVPAQAPRPAA